MAVRTLLLLVTLPSLAIAAPLDLAQFTDRDDTSAGWKQFRKVGAVTLWRRPVAGTSYYELRGQVDVPVAPEIAAAEVWASITEGDMATLKRREVLRKRDNELLIYDQINTPVVSDRDYTILIRRIVDGNRIQFRCITVDGIGPPPQKGFVRVPIIRAGWMVEPDGHGGSRIWYFSYSEAGGNITALIARGAQQDRAEADVTRIRDRILKRKP
jgi:hypothetical protein